MTYLLEEQLGGIGQVDLRNLRLVSTVRALELLLLQLSRRGHSADVADVDSVAADEENQCQSSFRRKYDDRTGRRRLTRRTHRPVALEGSWRFREQSCNHADSREGRGDQRESEDRSQE